MPTLHYLHYDVFTSRPFEGNQLAVFDDARGVSDVDMQRLTNEMNFAESTFVLPAETAGTDIRMRIFTPAREMPMAGHPTVGTTFALADQGVIASGRARWVFGLNIGPTPVALDWDDGVLRTAWMDQGRPELRPPVTPVDEVLGAINADRGGVEGDRLARRRGIVRQCLRLRAAGDARGGGRLRTRHRGDAPDPQRLPRRARWRLRLQRGRCRRRCHGLQPDVRA